MRSFSVIVSWLRGLSVDGWLLLVTAGAFVVMRSWPTVGALAAVLAYLAHAAHVRETERTRALDGRMDELAGVVKDTRDRLAELSNRTPMMAPRR